MRFESPHLFVAFFAVVATGCATGPAYPLYVPRVPSGDVDAIAAYVGAMRGATAAVPVVAERLDDTEFLRRLHQQDVCGDARRGRTGVGATWTAFGLTATEGEADRSATNLLNAGVSGFYDPDSKHLVVRKVAAGNREQNAFTIPHEIEHALQDARVGLRIACDRDADGRLAGRAMFEGDATVTSAAYEARHRGETDAHAIARVAKRLATLNDDELARATGGGLPVKAAPSVRAVFAWPYIQGSVLVAQLYRAGGWPLVDAALARPPASTEQVLHVEKYLAGEQPVEVAWPELPPGLHGVARGRMGEFLTSNFLGQCMKADAAKQAASGWGGDAYTLAEGAGGGRVLSWSTAWDDEGAAVRFAAALEARRACAQAPKPFTVVRQGRRVAYVQGVEEPSATPLVAKLLAAPAVVPPAAPPLGPVALPPPTYDDVDYEGQGRVTKGLYVNTFLGLQADVSRFTPIAVPKREDLRGWGLELLVQRAGAAIGMRFAWAPPSESLMESETQQWVDALRQSGPLKGMPVYDIGRAPMKLSWTTGQMRVLRFGEYVYSRVVLVPMCEGRLTLILDLFWNVEGGFPALQDWIDSLVRVGPADPPMCAAVRGSR
jgi:hypothetical protein